MKKKQFWYKVTFFFFLTAALVACGKKEESAQPAAQVPPVAESRSVNPESHAQGVGVSDTAAYATSSDAPTVFGLNLVDSTVPEGAVITSIVSGSQATKWDLQPADIIVKVGNTKIANKEDFKTVYDAINSGMTAEVTLLRDNQVHEVGILKL
jgi:S1-C subfamily serine protease